MQMMPVSTAKLLNRVKALECGLDLVQLSAAGRNIGINLSKVVCCLLLRHCQGSSRFDRPAFGFENSPYSRDSSRSLSVVCSNAAAPLIA